MILNISNSNSIITGLLTDNVEITKYYNRIFMTLKFELQGSVSHPNGDGLYYRSTGNICRAERLKL